MAIKQLNTTISQSPEGKSIAKIREIRGNSLVWNQLAPATAAEDDTSTSFFRLGSSIPKDHLVYISCCVKISADYASAETNVPALFLSNGGNTYGGKLNLKDVPRDNAFHYASGIATSQDSRNDSVYLYRVATSGTVTFKQINVIDLTLMFGAGNEPSTVAEFEAMFPNPYYAYNAGTLINNKAEAIETTGFNQWDEEIEEGRIDSGTGQNVNVTGRWRCKNYISVFPNTNYYFCNQTTTYVFAYDADMNYIGAYYGNNLWSTIPAIVRNEIIKTPSNCRYIRIQNYSGTTYAHDICINISDPSRNGTYEPYKKSTLPLNISTLTGKLNGEGESVVICSDGLKSAGSVYDYGIVENGYLTKIVKRIGVVDMGTLNFIKQAVSSVPNCFFADLPGGPKQATYSAICSKYPTVVGANTDKTIRPYGSESYNFSRVSIKDSAYDESDAATFKAAMNGVLLYYELAEPQTYVLDTPIYMGYETGTERIVPSNILQAPLIADIDYFSDAIKHIEFDSEKHCIRDERILGIDSEPTESSNNIITSGGVYDAIRNKKPLYTKTYTYKCKDATEAEAYIYFMNITPTSNEWATPWTVHYTLTIDCDTSEDANAKYCHGDYDVFVGCAGSNYYYHIFNKFYSGSYYPIYYHKLIYHNTEAKYNSYRDSHPAKAGVRVLSAWGSNTRTRKYTIKVYDYKNCVISFPDNIENHTTAYSSTYNSVVDFNATSIGLQETGDANTANYYNYEYYVGYRIHGTDTPLYRYKFVGFDDRNRIIPINITNQTNSTIVNKTACSVPMTVSNGLALYNTTTAITDASTAVATGTIYRDTSVVSGILQYNLSESVGRSSNSTTSRDIYLVGTYDVNTDEFTLDASSYTSFYKVVAILQSESDYYANFTNGKYYWYLGQCPVNDNVFNFQQHHPLFYFNGTKLIEVKSKAISEKEDKSNKVTSITSSSTNTQYPSAKAVYDHINTQLTSVLKYKGTIGTGGTVTTLPAAHSVGDVYVVSTAGTYAEKACEVGDYIICKTAGTSANNAHWDVINGENQVENKSASLAAAGSSSTLATVDGTNITVTTPSTWTGVAKTGTVTSITLKGTSPITVDSESALTTSGTRTISHANSGVTAGTYKSVTVDAKGHVTAGTNPTTVAGYGITDAVTSIGTSGNTLTWAKAGTAQTAITIPYATNADKVDGKHASDFELVTNKITSLSSSVTDTQYPSAKLVYDQLNTKSDSITGAWCAGSGAYWGKIFEYAYSGTSTVDNTATFLLTEYGTTSKGYSALLMIDVRGNSKTSISNIKANWIYKTSDTIQNVIKVTHYYENNTFYIRIYAYSTGWSLAVAGTLLQERTWAVHTKMWSGFKAAYTGNDVETFSQIPTDETEVTIENKIITAAGFKTPSGTSSQFLKADGSVDSNTYSTTDTKVTQTKTGSTNTSWRPLLLGYSYSDSNPFNPATVTNTTYAAHLGAFAPATGILKLVGLKKINTSGSDVTGATTTVWNTNGSTTDISGYLKFVSTTYANLVTLRSNSGLVTGCKYRITDYVATTTDSESRSVGHQFDIIVTAIANNKLSEEAKACLHSGDTYFANNNLNAWKVWYCLDNDTSRFSWANTTNGKGVVYRLIDEYLNDIPYDFKSIQFKRYKVTAKTEYPELTILNGFYIGLSGTLSFGLNINTSDFKWYYTFSTLGSAWTDDVTDASLTGTGCGTTTLEQTSYNGLLRDLNNVVFANGPVAKARRSSIYPDLSDAINIETVSINCYFGLNANNNTFVGNTTNSYMQSQCRNNITFGSGFRHSTISSDVQNNTIAVAGDFSFNRFEGGSSDGNIIVSTRNVTGNRFASSFRDNRINTDNNFTNNVFEGATLRNTFITAGTSEQIAYNTLESNFSDNTINCGLLSNRFGNSFYNNTIGTAASGAYIQSNDFGPYIHHNNFGNYFNFNRMLGQISYCSFGTYVFQCQFDPIMSYVDISNGTTSTMFSNVHVCGNIRGTSSVHISLDDSNFRVNGVSGVKRHITISGDTNGDITATWMSDDKLEGIYKTNGDALWTIMASAPQVNIPGNLPKKEIYDDSKRLVDVQGKYLSTNNTMENTAGPASVTKIYLVPCNEDLYIDIYGVTNSAAIPAAFRGVSSPFTIWKSYDFNHPGRWLRRETVRLDSSTQGDRANLYLFGSGGSPANLYKVQKILFLGSSWHMNTWWYLNKMFANANIVADIHGYYMGHSQFIEWTQLYNNDLTPLTGDEANRDARYCTSINGSDWTSYVFKDTFGSEPSTLTAQQYRDAFYNDLTSNDWDIIAFQQGANQAPYWEYWAHYKDLLSVLKRHCNKDTVLAFNATWAPAIDNYRLDTFGGRNSLASQKLWQKLNNACTQRFINESGIETVAPNGAMLWAMRQNSSLNVSGANDLTSDGIHPRHGVAMYGLAGCWWDTYIAPMYGIAFKDLSWYPDSNTQKIHFNGTSFQTISSTQLELIRKCVKVAQSDRFGFRTV